jgi:tetratricopeptide (TPR) repeat protein
MKPFKSRTNLLLVGDDEERMPLMAAALEQVFPGTPLIRCGTLRMGAPEASLADAAAVVVLWESNPQQDWRTLLEKKTATHRSSEGLVCDIASQGGDPSLRRTAILAKALSREEVTFLGEFGVGCVQPLNLLKSEWAQDCLKFARKIEKMIAVENDNGGNPVERSVRQFEKALKNWATVGDDEKIIASDELLRQLGDTARYCELMSRRALLENDHKTAEHWLRRSIDKNPNYLRALQGLADLFIERGQLQEALPILEKLRLNNPRHPGRLAKIAECHLALGNLEKADTAFSKSLSLDEHSMEAREDLARVKLAMGDFDSAKVLLEHCGDVTKVASYLNAYGIQLVRAGRYEESIEHYKKAQLVLPTNTNRHQILFNIGLAYAKWGRFLEARQYAQLALAREPNYAKAAQLLKTMEDRLTQ